MQHAGIVREIYTLKPHDVKIACMESIEKRLGPSAGLKCTSFEITADDGAEVVYEKEEAKDG